MLRQKYGYGCVVCGSFILDYEHLEPEFKDAERHDPDGMLLVCPTHHRAKNGMVSRDFLVASSKNPVAKQKGFSQYTLEWGQTEPLIIIGKNKFRNVKTLIRIEGEDVLSLGLPETLGAPFRLNAHLRDSAGDAIVQIVDNDWRVSVGNWDFEYAGNRLRFWLKPRSIELSIRLEAPHIVFERINMVRRDAEISCDVGAEFEVKMGGASFNQRNEALYENFDVGIDVRKDGIKVGTGLGILSNC